MQKSKKRILGIGGLAIVGAMTAYAFAVPTPDVDAVGSTSGAVNLRVNVFDSVASLDITSPANGTITLNNNMEIGLFYSQAVKISYTIANTTTGGSKNGEYLPAELNGTHALPIDLNANGLGFGRYRFDSSVNDGSDYASVEFYYIPLKMNTVANAENGDPTVEIEYASAVNSVDLQAYDSSNRPVFSSPINVQITNPGVIGTQTITLPFRDNHASSGQYTIAAIAKNAAGEVLTSATGIVSSEANYVSPDGPDEPDTPDTPDEPDTPDIPDTDGDQDEVAPDVPKTGGFLAELNMSRFDYLISGLIIFTVATVLAFVALRKQKNGHKR